MNLSPSFPRAAFPIRHMFRNFAGTSLSLVNAVALSFVVFAAPRAFARGPDVTIIEQPIQVEVVNESPVPVESVDDALREPYVQRGFVQMVDGSRGAMASVSIPAGKRLVVETISFNAGVHAGHGAFIRMRRDSDSSFEGTPLSPQFAMPWQDAVGDFTLFSGTLAMRFRVDSPADADGALHFDIQTDSDAGPLSSLTVVVMGYIVDL